MKKPRSMTARAAVDAMRHGASLVLMHDNTVPGGKSWCVVPGGRVSPEIAARILVRGDVVSWPRTPLLPGCAQTYRMLAFVE